MDAGKNLYQCRFSGTVLTKEGKHLPSIQRYGHIVYGDDSRKGLPDVLHFKQVHLTLLSKVGGENRLQPDE